MAGGTSSAAAAAAAVGHHGAGHVRAKLKRLLGPLPILTLLCITVCSRTLVFMLAAAASSPSSSSLSSEAGSMLLQARAAAASATTGGCKCDAAGSEEAHYEEFVGRLLNSSDPVVKAVGARLHREIAAQKGMGCNLDAIKQQVSWDRDDGVLRNVGMCVQMRNDAGILDEYIAFHWLQVGGHQSRV